MGSLTVSSQSANQPSLFSFSVSATPRCGVYWKPYWVRCRVTRQLRCAYWPSKAEQCLPCASSGKLTLRHTSVGRLLVAQCLESCPVRHGPPPSASRRPGAVVHSQKEVDAEVPGHPKLYNELQSSLGHMKLSQTKRKEIKKAVNHFPCG